MLFFLSVAIVIVVCCFQTVTANIHVGLIQVPSSSNWTLLCVDTLTQYGVNVNISTYCSDNSNFVALEHIDEAPAIPNSNVLFTKYIIFKGVAAHDIIQAFPVALNASLTAHGFFSRSDSLVPIVTDVGKNEGLFLGCLLGSFACYSLIALVFYMGCFA